MACLFGIWPLTIGMALLFRVPMKYRRMVEGVRIKQINKVFAEIDGLMSTRHTIGYFICLTCYGFMTVVVIFFNYFYP